MRNNKVRKNIIFGFGGQLIILLLGIVLPRLVMTSYGSEVNGLVVTVGQIFTYVALLEAGIGNAALYALYKPLASCDRSGVIDVFSAAKRYYRKVCVFYAICVVALTLCYPLVIRTDLPYSTVALVILLQGMSGVIGFYFSAPYKQVLLADGNNYIISNIGLLVHILTSVSKILLMLVGVDIIILQSVGFVISVISVTCYVVLGRRKYSWLEYRKDADLSILSERKAFLVHEFSGVIFSSTDAVLLSTFCSLKLASVYAIYNLIFSSLNTLINSINDGVIYILGHAYARDRKQYMPLHDAYDSLYVSLVFALYAVAYLFIIPFVTLYTDGVTDISYVDYWLPILFVSLQLLSCCRAVSSRLINIAGHAQNTRKQSIIEATINLVASLVLVQVIGIYGVLLGTVIALLYRTNDIIIYANVRILNRLPWKTYRIIFRNVLLFLSIVLLEWVLREWFIECCSNYIRFFAFAAVSTVLSLIVFIGAALIEKSTRQQLRVILGLQSN